MSATKGPFGMSEYVVRKLIDDLSDHVAKLQERNTDLLEACKELREVVTHDCGLTEEQHLKTHFADAILKANAAIARAEGQ